MDTANPRRDTFATYLAKQYIAQKGYKLGTVPEATDLAAASDIILTRADGLSFQIICIVDREARPYQTFALPRDAVMDIGRACLKYTGTVHRAKLSVWIQIIEVGPQGPDDAQRQRLGALRQRARFGNKVDISGWAVATERQAIWSNAPFNGWFVGNRFIKRLMRQPRASDAELRAYAPAAFRSGSFPYMTIAILAFLLAVFVAEQVFALDPSTGFFEPSIRTLVALGGLNKPLVLQYGEWYRILSATALHGGAIHLLFNGVALLMAGVVFERLAGHAWFGALYLVGAVGGSLVSLAVNPPSMVSIGASGAIMGLFTGAYACSFRLPSGVQRTNLQMSLLRVLVPSLIPLANFAGAQIDYGAHLGGALSGAAIGLMLLRWWPRTEALPRFRRGALVLSIVGALGVALCVGPIAQGYPTYALATKLMPIAEVPKIDAAGKARSADLVARFPHDPRARLLRAEALLDSGDGTGAERELRAGLAEQDILKTQFSPELEAQLRTVLAFVLADGGKQGEAKTIAQPVCSPAGPANMRDALSAQHLCD
jgi:rhomboid protease GluP